MVSMFTIKVHLVDLASHFSYVVLPILLMSKFSSHIGNIESPHIQFDLSRLTSLVSE